MRKADLVGRIAEETGVPKVDVLVVVEEMLKQIKDTMSGGDDVYIRGFGSFVIKKRKAKIGQNIKGKQSVNIPEHFVPSFKAAKIFAETVKANVTELPKSKGKTEDEE